MGIKSRLAGIAFAAAMVSLQILPSSGQTKARPVPSVDLAQLAHMRGPKKPAGAVFVGKDPQPTVGETKLPIQNVDVYQFPVKTQRGVVVNVKWAYTQGQGTYMWATAPFQCGDGTVVANGSYAMRVKEDGTGGYILGTNACPNGQVYRVPVRRQRDRNRVRRVRMEQHRNRLRDGPRGVFASHQPVTSKWRPLPRVGGAVLDLQTPV